MGPDRRQAAPQQAGTPLAVSVLPLGKLCHSSKGRAGPCSRSQAQPRNARAERGVQACPRGGLCSVPGAQLSGHWCGHRTGHSCHCPVPGHLKPVPTCSPCPLPVLHPQVHILPLASAVTGHAVACAVTEPWVSATSPVLSPGSCLVGTLRVGSASGGFHAHASRWPTVAVAVLADRWTVAVLRAPAPKLRPPCREHCGALPKGLTGHRPCGQHGPGGSAAAACCTSQSRASSQAARGQPDPACLRLGSREVSDPAG